MNVRGIYNEPALVFTLGRPVPRKVQIMHLSISCCKNGMAVAPHADMRATRKKDMG